MMRNFHTESSFEVNTESSPEEIRSTDEDYLFERPDDDIPVSRSQIYEGVFNMKIKKILVLLERNFIIKMQFWKLFAFRKLSMKPKPYQIKKNNFNLLYRLFRHFAHNQQVFQKAKAFQSLKSHYKNERVREIKMIQFCNKVSQTVTNILRKAFDKIGNEPCNGSLRKEERKSREEKLGLRILANIFKQKKIVYLCTLKCNVKEIKLNSNLSKPFDYQIQANKISSSSYKQKSTNSVMGSYLRQSEMSKKMSKAGHKLAEYKIESRNVNKTCYALLLVINRIFAKSIKKGFQEISKLKIEWREKEPKQNNEDQEEESDEDRIISNILKHVCWLSASEDKKRKLKRTKKSEDLRLQKLKILLFKKIRKQKQDMETAFELWNREAFEQKLEVADKIIELSDLKEKYIESCK